MDITTYEKAQGNNIGAFRDIYNNLLLFSLIREIISIYSPGILVPVDRKTFKLS